MPAEIEKNCMSCHYNREGYCNHPIYSDGWEADGQCMYRLFLIGWVKKEHMNGS